MAIHDRQRALLLRVGGLTPLTALFVYSLLTAVAGLSGAKLADDEPFDYDRLTRTVIRLERSFEGSQERYAVGTAFFIERQRQLFLITARHVTDDSGPLFARVTAWNAIGEKQPLELRVEPLAWNVLAGDSRRPDVHPPDLAAAVLPWPPAELHPLCKCPEPGNALDAPDPRPPDRVLAFGYPRDLGFELAVQRPLARSGIVAMADSEPFIPFAFAEGYANPGAFAVDMRSFPGNSGSPIFREAGFADGPVLVGILTGSYERFAFAIAEPISGIRKLLTQIQDAEPTHATWTLVGSSAFDTE